MVVVIIISHNYREIIRLLNKKAKRNFSTRQMKIRPFSETTPPGLKRDVGLKDDG